MVQKAKGKVPTLPKQINHVAGKVSNQSTGFNEVTWGMRCKSYVKSAKKLSGTRFNVVCLATEFMKVNHHLVDEDDDVIEINEDKDIRANTIDISSSSEDEA